jgi:tRNA G18 (ribose-2'-O)-methylase SpoU
VHIYLRHILLADLFERQSKFLVRIAALGKKTSLNVAPRQGLCFAN